MKIKSYFLTFMLAILLFMSKEPVYAEETRVVSSVEEFEAALADTTVDVIEVSTTLSPLQGSGSEPLIISRPVTICGGSLDLRYLGIVLGADVTFENIEINLSSAESNAIVANGYTLILDGVTRGSSVQWDTHIFCGGMAGYSYANIPNTGDHGEVIIKGNSYLGNIYAGNMGHSSVSESQYAGSASITIESTASGTIGDIYGCGGREAMGEGDGNAVYTGAEYGVAGDIQVTLYDSVVKNVVGYDEKLAVKFQGSGNLGLPKLENIASLEVVSGVLQPAAGSSFSASLPKISVKENGVLFLDNYGDLSIGNFEGGGELVLAKEQKINIHGTITGNTNAYIGHNVYREFPADDHTYIEAVRAQESQFVFHGNDANPAYVPVFVSDGADGGIWTTAVEVESVITVTEFGMEDYSMEEVDDFLDYIEMPVSIAYTSQSNSNIDVVELEVRVNGQKAEVVYDGEYVCYKTQEVYCYPNSAGGECVFTVWDSDYQTVPQDGKYHFSITIPGEYTESRSPLTAEATLILGKNENENGGETGGGENEDEEEDSEEEIPEGIRLEGIDENGYEYTGEPIKPEVQIYDGKHLLQNNVDYTLHYKNNIDAADKDALNAPTVIIRMKGQYEGTRTLTYSILPRNIDADGDMGYEQAITYKKEIEIPVPILYYRHKQLVKDRDFVCDYTGLPENYRDGDAYEDTTVYSYEVKGIGNFTGSFLMNLVVVKDESLNLENADVRLAKYTYEYDGDPMVAEEVQVEYVRTGGVDVSANYYQWTVWADKTGAGSLWLEPSQEGKNAGYHGRKEIPITLVADRKLRDVVIGENWQEEITFSKTSLEEKGGMIQDEEGILAFPMAEEPEPLVEGRDYTVKYKNTDEIGKATVTFYGKGRYAGTLQKSYRIIPNTDLSVQWLDVDDEDNPYAVYQKEGAMPRFELLDKDGNVLSKRTDYTTRTKNNRKPGIMTLEIIGRDNYKGYRLEQKLEVKLADISQAAMEIDDQVYTEDPDGWKADVIIRDINGEKLKAGKDYEEELIYHYDNMDEFPVPQAGTTVFVTAQGKNNYAGSSLTGYYRICKWNLNDLEISIDDQIYTGKEIELQPDDIHFYANVKDKWEGKEMKDCTYEILDYQNNIRVGFARVTLRGTGDYGGIQKSYFIIQKRNLALVAVSSFALNTEAVEGVVGDTFQLKVRQIQPENANDTKVLWESSDDKVASVDDNGEISLNKPGMAIITATFKYSECVRKCTVWVENEETDLPEGTYLIPQDFKEEGDADDTASFNRAINKLEEYGYDTLYVPAGTYWIDALTSIQPVSNMKFIMSPNAVLQTVANASAWYDVIELSYVTNVTISGGQIIGERSRHIGSEGEWGMGIGLYDSKNIMIFGVKISDCWGDGIYIGTNHDDIPYYGCAQITVANCVLNHNRRNNLSIVSGDNITIDGCIFSNAKGTDPQYGIDIETNNSENPCEHITISNSVFTGNEKGSLGIVTAANDITVSNCELKGQFINYAGTNVVLSNSAIYDETYARIGISMINGTRINGESETADALIASFDVGKDNFTVGTYNQDASNTMLKGYMGSDISPSGKVLRMERTSQGNKESGYYLDLSDLMNGAGTRLQPGSIYRFEYTVRGSGQWGVKTDQTTWYPCAPQSDKFATGVTVYEAKDRGNNCRLIFFAQEMTKGMFLEVDSVKIYKVN